MKKIYKIPKVSKKQAKRNRDIANIKSDLNTICACRNCRNTAIDPAHLLPRSTFPEFYTEEWNIVGMCRRCHTKYDDNREFRQSQTHLYEIVKANAGEQKAYRHFRI